MNTKIIFKSLLVVAALSLTTSLSAHESEAKQVNYTSNYDNVNSLNTKLVEAKKAVSNFKRLKTIKTHRQAQWAVNKLHAYTSPYFAYEKNKLQRQIDIVLKYNTLK